MKYKKIDLDNLKFNNFHFVEDLNLDASTFPKSLDLLDLKDIHVEGNCNYNSYLESLDIEFKITGIMVMPCARTLVPVDHSFNINESVCYSFIESSDENAIIIEGNEIDTDQIVHDLIALEVPMRVFAEGTKPIEPKEEKQIDPRLAKLLEFKVDK